MSRCLLSVGCVITGLTVLAAGVFAARQQQQPSKDSVKTRTFHFTYNGTIAKLPPGQTVKVWLPVPISTTEQDVVRENISIPAKFSETVEPQYGNTMLYFEAQPDKDGKIALSMTFKVTRREVKTGDQFRKPGEKEKIQRFLEADKLVPVGGKPLELVKGVQFDKDQFKVGKTLYDIVNRHMRYSKEGTGWGRGDAEWACDSKYGNCSDFHSLFISLCRSQKVPAKFEMGFMIPTKGGEGAIPGCHCWAWFLPDGKGWVPVDISEANRNPEMREYYFGNLTENRVQFTTGRDIDLVPRQAGPALNLCIYPYAEVGGQPVPIEQIDTTFSVRNS